MGGMMGGMKGCVPVQPSPPCIVVQEGDLVFLKATGTSSQDPDPDSNLLLI